MTKSGVAAVVDELSLAEKEALVILLDTETLELEKMKPAWNNRLK